MTEPTPEATEPECTCPIGERDPLCPWHNWFEERERSEEPES